MSEANEGAGGIKHVRPGEGTSLWFFGGLVTFYALGEDTGGAFTLLEEATEPESAAFPHVHHEEDQAFYILQGNHEFVCDGETFITKPGSFVYIPRGMVHSFTNVGTTPGKIMVLSTPAGGTPAPSDRHRAEKGRGCFAQERGTYPSHRRHGLRCYRNHG